MKSTLCGTLPEGTVRQGFGSALSRFPQKIFVYVTVLDIKSIYTRFLFSQVQVHISRDIGNSCEVDNFLRHLPSFLSVPLSTHNALDLVFLQVQHAFLPGNVLPHLTITQNTDFNHSTLSNVPSKFKSFVFAFLDLL